MLLLLCVQESQLLQARVGCFILTDTISNSGAYADLKELAFSECKNVVFIQRWGYDTFQLQSVLEGNTVSCLPYKWLYRFST